MLSKFFYTRVWISGFTLLLCVTALAQTPATEQFRLQALRAEAGQPSVYEVTITSPQILEADAEFVLEFPLAFDLSVLMVAGSPDMSGGFSLSRDGQRVRVKRSGAGESIQAHKPVHLRLGAIMNPEKLEPNYQIGVQVQTAAATPLSALQKTKVEFQHAETKE